MKGGGEWLNVKMRNGYKARKGGREGFGRGKGSERGWQGLKSWNKNLNSWTFF